MITIIKEPNNLSCIEVRVHYKPNVEYPAKDRQDLEEYILEDVLERNDIQVGKFVYTNDKTAIKEIEIAIEINDDTIRQLLYKVDICYCELESYKYHPAIHSYSSASYPSDEWEEYDEDEELEARKDKYREFVLDEMPCDTALRKQLLEHIDNIGKD